MRVRSPLFLTSRQKGMTLVELMVALAISLVLVLAATYVYLASWQSDRALERSSDARETGSFVLQLIGRELMNAGFYPATRPPMVNDVSQTGMIDGYPPYEGKPRLSTDWMNTAANWPPTAFMAGVFGCDDAPFDVSTNTCGATVAGSGDSIVINYFTGDSFRFGAAVGTRRDCAGNDVGNDSSNQTRKANTGGNPPLVPHTGVNQNLPPQLPLFVSNRYRLSETKVALDRSDVSTNSLMCNGNGNLTKGYQPVIAGVAGMQFTYGVTTDPETVAPSKFYRAAEVSAMTPEWINGQLLSGWQRVSAVQVCILAQTLGGGTRLADKAGAPSKYLDCDGAEQNQPSGSTMTRYTQVFGVRNALKQTF